MSNRRINGRKNITENRCWIANSANAEAYNRLYVGAVSEYFTCAGNIENRRLQFRETE